MVFLIGLASATITLNPSVSSLSQTSGSFNLTVSSNQNETINLDIPSITNSGKNIVFSLSPNQVTINTVTNPSEVVSVDYTVEDGFNFEFLETYTAEISAAGTVSGDLTKKLDFEESSFCESENKGDLSTTIRSVKVIDGFGKDGDWYPFDTIQFDVRVINEGDEDVDNIILEWGLYDAQSRTWVIEVDEETDFDLDSGDRETTTISFDLDNGLDEDLQDMEKGDYILYARATGEIADGTYEGDDTCSSDSETGKLKVDRDFVILSNIDVPDVIQCDSETPILADVWNIGSKDQNDVYVKVYNNELGINEKVDIGDIDSFDSSDFNFILNLPEEVEEKTYTLTLTVYDDNDDVYKNGDKDTAEFDVSLNVKGNCAVAKASVIAVLQSGGEAGKPLVVGATITNTGNNAATYLLNIAGYTNWASSVDLDKSSLTLDSGESGDVLLTFDVKKEALGTNLFTLEVLSKNQLVVSQPIQVDITRNKFSLAGLFSGNKAYIWGIGILNIILVILIIIIAVRISRK